MERVGFLGLGQMGKPMAHNLVRAGFTVFTCVHRDESPVNELQAAGAIKLATAADVARESQFIILSLPDPAAVRDLLYRPDGILEGLNSQTIIIDTGTTGIRVTQECGQAVGKKGCFWLDAPVSGGVWGAKAGTLTFMVGGDRAAVEAVQKLLQAMGKMIVHVGKEGSGQVTKLVNNLLACISTAAISEAFALGVKAGVDVKALYDVVSHSSGNSWVLENAAPRTIFISNYQPGGRLRTMTKDLDLVKEIAKEYGAPLFLGGLVYELQTLMMTKGHGDEEAGVIARFYEEILGVSLASEAFEKVE